MCKKLHNKTLKSGYPWEVGLKEGEQGFLPFILLTSLSSLSSEFFRMSMSSNIIV